MVGHNPDVCGLSPDAVPMHCRLVYHNFSIRKRHPFPPAASGQQKRTETGGQSQANGGYITGNILHGIIDRKTCRYTAAGTVYIKLNILPRILGLQIEHLGNHQTGRMFTDLFLQKYDPVRKQP